VSINHFLCRHRIYLKAIVGKELAHLIINWREYLLRTFVLITWLPELFVHKFDGLLPTLLLWSPFDILFLYRRNVTSSALSFSFFCNVGSHLVIAGGSHYIRFLFAYDGVVSCIGVATRLHLWQLSCLREVVFLIVSDMWVGICILEGYFSCLLWLLFHLWGLMICLDGA